MKTLYIFILLVGLVSCSSENGGTNREMANGSGDSSQNPDVIVVPVSYAEEGQTVPKPVFQVGDTPSEPIAQGSPEAQGFIDFYNKTYLGEGIQLPTMPMLGKDDVVWFPPQSAGDTSLELVVRTIPGQTSNCDSPDSYPIFCDDDDFSTGEFCKACHDSVLFVEGGGLPEMAYFSEAYSNERHETWLANWSQYGDWSANIMRLATRDPIWQAQIETETNKHPYADPAVIQDVCFSCHGEMGERQLKVDLAHDGKEQTFCTDLFYATIPGYLSDKQQGKPYPFTGDCEPIAGKPIAEHQELYAKYGSLARDGVSCETCHRIGPENGNGQWNGTDFQVFYGPDNTYNVSQRQTANPVPLVNEFTATFEYDMDNIMTPDPVNTLDSGPMKTSDNLNMAQAYNQKDQLSYLGQSVLCGACHVLIVPQIPTLFQPGMPLPDAVAYPYYKKPDACQSEMFAPATNGKYGNPVTDDCVALGYEQATYLEWINSDFASEEDNENTCQACHMPWVTDPSNAVNHPINHKAIMAQSTPGLTPKDYRRHRLTGINLPVFEMFMQFPDVLGVAQYDDQVPPSGVASDGEEADFIQNYLLNGQMAIVEQATNQANGNGLVPNSVIADEQAATQIQVNSSEIAEGKLVTDLTILNNTGHKFPSGAGFRRAFLKFEVLDSAGQLLWVSGQTNPYGAICNGVCQKTGSGEYNLLASEVTGGDPGKLQPHYQVISTEDQVQIYEVQSVNDDGLLTSRTLSLFYDAKDNRLLPRGFMQPDELGCAENSGAGNEIFGIPQCSAAYATESQIDHPLTINSAIASDKHYTNSAFAGSDTISYQIPLTDIDGTAASVRVTMEYQTIPPAYLAARFKDGYSDGAFLTATERSIYLTSHLNTNLPLKSEHPDNPDLLFSNNWTTSIYQAKASLQTIDAVTCKVFDNGMTYPSAASDGIYFSGPSSACVSEGNICRKWFGSCEVLATGEQVSFKVFNSGGTPISMGAIYVPSPNWACIPDGSPQGDCREQFGMATTTSGRNVECSLFNSGYTDITEPTSAMVYNDKGQVCIADEGGACRKWFGLCQVVNE